MVCAVFLVALVFLVQGTSAANWALLVAGSTGYGNYRHQADVCHAYQVLKNHGFPESNIIVMMKDDVANSYRNPVKGTLINRPDGPDVYHGVSKDYTGSHLLASNFLNILSGNETLMKGKGSGRVIKSGPEDTIFVYYADHGASGHIAFPHGGLYEYKLTATIKKMHANKQYKKLVFYIEACYSGSMFRNHLKSDIGVLGITAANHRESSYAKYYDRKRHTYLGDEFSVNWLEDSDGKEDWAKATINDQYERIKSLTRRSHVMKYGDLGLGDMLLSELQGPKPLPAKQSGYSSRSPSDGISTWDVPYAVLVEDLKEAKSAEERTTILKEMQRELETREAARNKITKIAEHFISDVTMAMKVGELPTTEDEQKCYERVTETFRKYVSEKEFEYAMEHLQVFENLCVNGFTAKSILKVMKKTCA
jgi:legumain